MTAHGLALAPSLCHLEDTLICSTFEEKHTVQVQKVLEQPQGLDFNSNAKNAILESLRLAFSDLSLLSME